MRIAMISHSNSPWAAPYARHFQQAGHDVLIISMHPHEFDGVKIVSVGRKSFDMKRGKTLFFTRVPRIRRILAEYRPDVVFATYLTSNGLTAALAWRGPLVVSMRGCDGVRGLCARKVPRWLAQQIVRWTCGRANLVHAVSERLRRDVIRLGIPKERTFVVPLGVDTEQFAPLTTPVNNDPPHIVCVRKHEPVYRIGIVIKALAELRSRGFMFRATFAADGPLLNDHKQLARIQGLDDCVSFVGDVSRQDVAELLRSADVYVSAAVSDGTASSLLEAMSVGVFPVVSRIEANLDWIEEDETGLFFETDSVDSTSGAIAKALADSQLRERSRRANRERVVARADYGITMPKLIARLEDVAGKYVQAT